MAAKPKHTPVKRVVFDAPAIAKALHVPESVAVAKFKDGRVAGQWTELWGARLYAYVVHGHANVPATDGAVSAAALGDLGVSVKSLTARGVKFQQSVYVGAGRSCSQGDLINSISKSDRHLVVDVRAFPTVDFVVLTSTWLLNKAHAGALTPGGWSGGRLYDELSADKLPPEVEVIDLD